MQHSRVIHITLMRSAALLVLACSRLSSPIRTIPSALELPQILPLHTQEWLAGYTADQELRRQLTCLPSPCPEDISVFNYDTPMIAYREVKKQISQG